MREAAGPAASPYAALVLRLSASLATPAGRGRSLLMLLFAALFLSTPAWERLPLIVRTTGWRVFNERVEAPLSQPRATEASHSGKTAFRLVVPLVARLLRLGPYGVLALQAVCGILLLWLVLKLSAAEAGDACTAFFVAACLAFGYVGKAAFVDLYAWFDAWAFLFLTAALAARGVLLPFVFASLAAWTDERALVALGLVAAFHLATPPTGKRDGPPLEALAVVAAGLGYLGLRAVLASAYGLYTPTADTGLGLIQAQRPLLALGAFTGLEGGWMIVLAAPWAARRRDARTALALMLATAAAVVLVSWSVIDMTRSAAYAFPAVFVALRLLAPVLPSADLRATAFASAVVSLLFQDHYLQTGWQQPILLRLFGP